MTELRKVNIVHTATYTDELGKEFTVTVPVTLEEIILDGRNELIWPGEASRALEKAIEEAYPGWFHTCYTGTPKEKCAACKRTKLAKLKNSDKVL